MAKITSEMLKRIAPQTAAALRDRFLPYLNEALPRYGIISELQVAAFLATAAFESMYFRKTKEGKAKPTSTAWIKYQSKYWHTNFMGRGIFQTTSEKNYRIFGQKMKRKGLVTDSEIFVKQPELLEQPRWAVESACEFWDTNGLDKYARQGFKGFTALQGVVNRGSASKIALGQPDRLVVYEQARLALPDDFVLNSAASTAPANNTATPNPPVVIEPQDEVSPINQDAVSTTIEQTQIESSSGESAISTTVTQGQNVVIESRENEGFLSKTWKKITGVFAGNALFSSISDYAQQVQAFGLSPVFWERLFYIAIGATLIWLIFEAVKHFSKIREERERDRLLASVNSTESNTVEFAAAPDLEALEKLGYKVIRRK